MRQITTPRVHPDVDALSADTDSSRSDDDNGPVRFAAVANQNDRLQEELLAREAREAEQYKALTAKVKGLVSTIAELRVQAQASRADAARGSEVNRDLLAKIEVLKDQQEVRWVAMSSVTLLFVVSLIWRLALACSVCA
jgi:hypothetical protein